MKKVFCIGEMLIDFISQPGNSLAKTTNFIKTAGGAPANVAVAVAKLGGQASFIGNLGDDGFGDFLLTTLKNYQVDITHVTRSCKTTLAFVAIDKNGEREFEFYRGSDGDFKLSDINVNVITSSDIIHFGSATALINSELKNSYFDLLEFAVGNKNFISFDPNFRGDLINSDSLHVFISDCKLFISQSDLVKVSEIEAQLISGEDDLELAATYLLNIGAKVVIVTLGSRGALFCTQNTFKIIPSRSIQQVDSTGAGDAFMGGLLFKLAQHNEPNWEGFIAFANLIGAYSCSNFGAISSLPTMRQFLEFIS